MDPAELTLADIAPFVDPQTALGIEVAVQKRNVAILTQQVAERDARIAELEDP
jgi:hypothetical protein